MTQNQQVERIVQQYHQQWGIFPTTQEVLEKMQEQLRTELDIQLNL